ncbi:MAG: double zinc ribbon domain-containing protein [Alphaproteobacteria bacterium]
MFGTIKARFNLTSTSSKVADLLYPPHCPMCNEPAMALHRLCDACWPKLEQHLPPFCDCCAEALPAAPTGYAGPLMCGDCLDREPAFDRLRAPLVYSPSVRPLVLAFKRFGQDGLVNLFQPHLQRTAAELLANTDLVAPVPLHWSRLWKRGYNQAALLANCLDFDGTPASLQLDLLRRVKRTKPQGRSSAANRYKNLSKAIAVVPAYKDLVQGRRVLVVDDVTASGATLNTCAKVLKRAGAAEVSCLVLAKSLRNAMYEDEEFDL